MIADRIEKTVTLAAPIDRVWQALTDSAQFGTWFEVAIEGPFVAGQPASGTITTKGYEHLRFAIEVERLDRPAGVFAFRWHPFAVDPALDYRAEPMTLVELVVRETPGGTQLTVTESGFAALPAARRELALRMNDGGWAQQGKNLAAYLGELA